MKKILIVLRRILLGLLALILVAVGGVSVIAGKNAKAMNSCLDAALQKASEGHTITEMDAGEYSQMRLYGVMNFHVKQYKIEELGNLSVMTVNVGLMQMATLVFSPFEKDLPLLSCDYMYILGNRKAYLEFYDLAEKDDTYMAWIEKFNAIPDTYSDIPETTASSAWYDDLLTADCYKAGKTKDDEQLKALLVDTVSAYMEMADAYPLLADDKIPEKKARIKEYSDRLVDEGGISTSFFKKAIGPDATKAFFDQVFFGTAQ